MRQPLRRAARQAGAALLLAMVILTLVATVASGMVWQQQRAVDVEGAERARLQASWMMTGAIDWTRMIVRQVNTSEVSEDMWLNRPFAEARISTFFAVDRNNTLDSGLDAFLSGAIVDAQSRWNLRNLVDAKGEVSDADRLTLIALCNAAAVPSDTAARLEEGLSAAWAPANPGAANPTPPTTPSKPTIPREQSPIAPTRMADLVWLGLDQATVARLVPYMEILITASPAPTQVNLNTASTAVMRAVIPGLDGATAERIVQARPLDEAKVQTALAPFPYDTSKVSVSTQWLEVTGRIRLETRVLEETLLMRRATTGDRSITVVRRERRNQFLSGG